MRINPADDNNTDGNNSTDPLFSLALVQRYSRGSPLSQTLEDLVSTLQANRTMETALASRQLRRRTRPATEATANVPAATDDGRSNAAVETGGTNDDSLRSATRPLLARQSSSTTPAASASSGSPPARRPSHGRALIPAARFRRYRFPPTPGTSNNNPQQQQPRPVVTAVATAEADDSEEGSRVTWSWDPIEVLSPDLSDWRGDLLARILPDLNAAASASSSSAYGSSLLLDPSSSSAAARQTKPEHSGAVAGSPPAMVASVRPPPTAKSSLAASSSSTAAAHPTYNLVGSQPIHFTVDAYDGGVSGNYPIENILDRNANAYCSDKASNVNIRLRFNSVASFAARDNRPYPTSSRDDHYQQHAEHPLVDERHEGDARNGTEDGSALHSQSSRRHRSRQSVQSPLASTLSPVVAVGSHLWSPRPRPTSMRHSPSLARYTMTTFLPSRVTVQSPITGYSAPCTECLVLMSYSPVELYELDAFDDFTYPEFERMMQRFEKTQSLRPYSSSTELIPLAFLRLSFENRFTASATWDHLPIPGRYIYLKLISSFPDCDNIDLMHVEVQGMFGEMSSASAEFN
ncbi:hypothetical protein H4R35_003270 [Dimargaris xerosporica]|nr:hypothetical protein H4R35_003270 [Dimargaris xerosporica]